MIIAITGRPGIGKSTVCLKVIEMLRNKGFAVGGIICPEIREKNVRVGFKVLDLISGKEGLLAHVRGKSPFTVGKYYVLLDSFENIAIPALEYAINHADIIVFDEVGPMELKSKKILNIISSFSNVNKPILLVVHWKIGSNIRHMVKCDCKIFEVTFDNRDKLPSIIFNLIVRGLT
ncbi:MAG: NTPase [Candidatus Methanomethylicia archaeon]|nr:NTPase [Candidatus Methanomethylicia archaeon]MCX8169220.1 NTPase [Candidatus Methanomethylicia archaeon]MDW7988998.1 NTPase [Nitrososphaerota archaeon]